MTTDWPEGSGEMALRIREHDWSGTPLGPLESWPQRLKTTIDLMLVHGFPDDRAVGVGADRHLQRPMPSIVGRQASGAAGPAPQNGMARTVRPQRAIAPVSQTRRDDPLLRTWISEMQVVARSATHGSTRR